MDNPFDIPTEGQADWDSALDSFAQSYERGYHITQAAGVAINTGQLLALNSAGFFTPFDPTSTPIPIAMAFTAAASGDSLTALAWGIVRSLAVNSVIYPGMALYGGPAGTIVGSGVIQIGWGLSGRGVLFNPAKAAAGGTSTYTPTFFSTSLTINAVVGSLHTFTASLGSRLGWNRRLRLNASSATHVELKLYADAGLTDLQYSTLSGGVSAVASFNDRAGFPWDTNSGTMYGTFAVKSWDVGSDTATVILAWEI